ncbi:MAG: hypothetical protein HQ500_08445 [Flavobacteriales bacterium]|nr:hypothetical protein [Flavobacteriales bacterium]
MIQSGAKVTVEETDAGTIIAILPDSSPWQRIALSVWSGVWVFTGILAMVGMLKELEKDTLPFLLVFMAFWFYFLFYAIRSLIWQRAGSEFLRLSEDTLDYKRTWNAYGKVRSYDFQTIKNLGTVNYDDKKFAKTYNDAFWTIGGEMIGFEYIGKKVAMGFKLSDAQAKDIVRRVEKQQRKQSKH